MSTYRSIKNIQTGLYTSFFRIFSYPIDSFIRLSLILINNIPIIGAIITAMYVYKESFREGGDHLFSLGLSLISAVTASICPLAGQAISLIVSMKSIGEEAERIAIAHRTVEKGLKHVNASEISLKDRLYAAIDNNLEGIKQLKDIKVLSCKLNSVLDLLDTSRLSSEPPENKVYKRVNGEVIEVKPPLPSFKERLKKVLGPITTYDVQQDIENKINSYKIANGSKISDEVQAKVDTSPIEEINPNRNPSTITNWANGIKQRMQNTVNALSVIH